MDDLFADWNEIFAPTEAEKNRRMADHRRVEDLTSAVFGAADEDELRQIIEDHMSRQPPELSPEDREIVDRFWSRMQSNLDTPATTAIAYPDGMVPLEFIVRSQVTEERTSTSQEDQVTAALAAATDDEAIQIIDRAITASGIISSKTLARRVLECVRSPEEERTDPEMVYAEGVLIRLTEVRMVSK